MPPQRLKRGDVTLASRLDRDLGIDSLARTELVLRIERAFQVRLPSPKSPRWRRSRDLAEGAWSTPRRVAPAPALCAASRAAGKPSRSSASPITSSTLTEMLDCHAENHPDHIHVTVLQDENVVLGTV